MPQNEEPSTKNLPSRSENDDWDDMSPDIKQRFQELARKNTELRTKYDASRYLAAHDYLETEPSLHDELCAVSDLLDLEEDYTND